MVVRYFFCLFHKSAFTFCHSVSSGLVATQDLQPHLKNHCHKTFPSSVTNSKETQTELGRFSHLLITLIVICYNAVRHKPFRKKFPRLRGVGCCLLMFSQNSSFGRGEGRTKTSSRSFFARLLISVTTVWSSCSSAASPHIQEAQCER